MHRKLDSAFSKFMNMLRAIDFKQYVQDDKVMKFA